jgi:RNA polymerase sigma-70 factor (ECF subfamily)
LARELEALYEAHYERFVRVSTAIVGDEATARDAVQDAFARALARLDTYRAEAPLEGWVWRIVVNAALAARQAKPLSAEDADGTYTVNGTDELGVRAWIAALPERQRLAVFLRYYADLDYRGIAAALRIEVGTVSATLSAAHRALRLSLKEVER